jgi:sugar phosphate isomerase/epimerase
MSTARLAIIEGIELLRKYAPEILSEEDAKNFKREIENNGLWIAMADINMTKDRNQGRENENIQNHRIYVEKVFNIAEKIDNLIIQAVSQNRGQETITVEPDRSSEEIEWHSPGVTASEEDWNKLIKLLKSEGNSFQASS